ncbi:MAG: transglutaminase domain-containing protein, partial [Planctomycetota bacterium]
MIWILLLSLFGGDDWPDGVDRALALAGSNRPELERVLAECRRHADPRRLEAACFLISHMEEHGYSEIGVVDENGSEVAFDALAFESLEAARAHWRSLEEEHGPLRFRRVRFHADLEVISADLLLAGIEDAFRAWEEIPESERCNFEVFLEHVLPYRASNEPLEPWREICRERVAGRARSEDGARIVEAAQHWIGFSDLYYLHPTDQGLGSMLESGVGRCEDMSILATYAVRSTGRPAAADYTPYWADFDNNHAWTVALDRQGRGHIDLFHRAAKVYRKTYSLQPENLAFRAGPDEVIPAWLSGRAYRDVTSDYYETIDVGLALEHPRSQSALHAYLCVFNVGQWKPIHWSEVKNGHARFNEMTGDVLYLPATFDEEGIHPAGRPFILEANGHCRFLEPDPVDRVSPDLQKAYIEERAGRRRARVW